jgi:hypothetical protein
MNSRELVSSKGEINTESLTTLEFMLIVWQEKDLAEVFFFFFIFAF